MAEDFKAELRSRFEAFCGGRKPAELSPEEGVRLMLAFFEQVKFPQAEQTPTGDMVLFQYGIFDFGRGENFEFDITRQVSLRPAAPEEADDSIYQISLTFFFPPESFRGVPSINGWSKDYPDIAAFARFIRSTQATDALKTLVPQRVDLDVETV